MAVKLPDTDRKARLNFVIWYLNGVSKNLKIKIYRTIILIVVLYECETWSLTLREERSLRVTRHTNRSSSGIPVQKAKE